MDNFLLKEDHKIYNYADYPHVERRVYWLFRGDEKKNLIVEVENYNEGHIFNFYIEDEKSSDHYLIKNMKKVAEISSIRKINEEKVIRILNSSKIEGTSINEQYLKQIDEEVYIWIKSVDGLDLSSLKDDLV